MILKQYEVSKINTKQFPLILFYGQNNGAKEEEISNIVLAIKTLEKDKSKKMLITDYQFISVFLKEYDYVMYVTVIYLSG